MEQKDSFSGIKQSERRQAAILEFRKDLQWILETIFNQNEPSRRTQELVKKLDLFLAHLKKGLISEEQVEKIRSDLADCSVSDLDEFKEEAMQVLQPLVDFMEKYPIEFEEAQSKVQNELNGYIELNRLVTYEKVNEGIALHHPAALTIGPKRELYRDAMKKLAKIIEIDPEIKKIEAVSWIVAKIPRLFTENGFKVQTLKGRFSSRSRVERDDYGKEIALAYMSREDFLARFLEK